MFGAGNKSGAKKYAAEPGLYHFWLVVSIAFLLIAGLVIYLIVWGQLIKTLFGLGSLPQVSVMATGLLGFGLGGFYWGRQVEGESSAAPYTLVFAALTGLILAQLVPFSLKLAAPFENYLYPFWIGRAWGHYLCYLLAGFFSFLPVTFCLGGAWSLLAEIGLGRPQNLERGLAWIYGASFLGGVFGILVWFLAAGYGLFTLQILAGVFNLAGILLGVKLARRALKAGEIQGTRRLIIWPRTSWGTWSGHTTYGSSIDITPAAVKMSAFALVLAGFALAGFQIVLLKALVILQADTPLVLGFIWLICLLGLFGGSTANRFLNFTLGPVISLALSLLILAVLFIAAPWLIFKFIEDVQAGISWFWLIVILFIIFVPAGVMASLSGQIIQSRRGWLASSLGLAAFWIVFGAFLGIVCLTLWGWPLLGFQKLNLILAGLMFLAAVFTISSVFKGPLMAIIWGLSIFVGGLFFIITPQVLFSGPLQKLEGAKYQALNTMAESERHNFVGLVEVNKLRLILSFYNDNYPVDKADKLHEGLVINGPRAFEALRPGLEFIWFNRDDGPSSVDEKVDYFDQTHLIHKNHEFARRALTRGDAQFKLVLIVQDSIYDWPDQTLEFYELMEKRLVKGGVAGMILDFDHFQPVAFRALINTWAEIFPESVVWKLNDRQILIASQKTGSQYQTREVVEAINAWESPAADVLAQEAGLSTLRDLRYFILADQQVLKEMRFLYPLVITDNNPYRFSSPVKKGENFWAEENKAWFGLE